MSKLTIVVGLPGSGKSTYIAGLPTSEGQLHGDDLFGGLGMRWLIIALQRDVDVVISDVVFVDTLERQKMSTFLQWNFPAIETEWVFFENNPVQCIRNIRHRNRPGYVEREIADVEARTGVYVVPAGARVMAVTGT